MHLDRDDPWCRLPGVECGTSVPARRAAQVLNHGTSSQPFHLFTAPCQGVDCKPGRRHILQWPMSARGRQLYPPQKGSLCSAPVCVCTCLQCNLPAVQLGERNRWKSAGGLLQEPALLHHVALSADSVVLCHCGRWYVAAVEWSPGIAISAIATRHGAAPAASS